MKLHKQNDYTSHIKQSEHGTFFVAQISLPEYFQSVDGKQNTYNKFMQTRGEHAEVTSQSL